MTETHVTGAGMRVPVDCDGRRYVLRPIAFGEAAGLAAAEAAIAPGGAAALAEAVRVALEAKGDAAKHIEALDRHEAAEILHASVLLTRPHEQEPPDAWTAWRQELQRAQAEIMRADAGRRRAESEVADDPGVKAARAAQTQAVQARAVRLLQLALVGWPGRPEGGTETIPEAELLAMPEADIVALYSRAEALRRPGVTEGKA
jgi:hypothetical protein